MEPIPQVLLQRIFRMLHFPFCINTIRCAMYQNSYIEPEGLTQETEKGLFIEIDDLIWLEVRRWS